MRTSTIILFIIFWTVPAIFANETQKNHQNNTLRYSTEETHTNQIFFISALNERFEINQARQAECMINSSIDEFPQDVFTNTQRQNGAIVLHFLGAIYFFTLLGVVCNDYFLPSVECICDDLNISKDVAAATFMASATTTPEFFTNAISTFVMDSDMGLGTIIGSLMFNTLGVAALAGLFSVKTVQLERFPITRDCILYTINLLILIWFAWDSKIVLYESVILVILYFVYFIILFQNERIKKFITKLVARKKNCNSTKSFDLPSPEQVNSSQEKIENNSLGNNNNNNNKSISSQIYDQPDCVSANQTNKLPQSQDITPLKQRKSLWTLPKGKCIKQFWWFYTWPIKFILTLTIPSPKTYRKLYPLTFVCCVLWIGANSYLIVWMMTTVGHTYSLPESVMGLTFLAAGGCTPEAISSVLMIRKGEGGIGVSNSLGANSLAILMSLGVPWLIRNIVYYNDPDKSYVLLSSSGIEYTIVSLLLTTALLYTVLAIAKYRLNKPVGFSLFTIYITFLIIGVLIEFDIIFPSGHCL